MLPRSVQIPLCYDQTGTPLYHGGFAEIWKGQYQGRDVAVKVLKVYQTSNFEKITRVGSHIALQARADELTTTQIEVL